MRSEPASPESDRMLRAMRLGGRFAYLSGAIGAVGVVLWFARFAYQRSVVGWLNDVFVMIQYALALPIAFALHTLLGRHGQRLSQVALVLGIAGILGIVVLQFLLVAGALTFAQQVVPVTIAILVAGVWIVITGYLARSTGWLPHSLLMSLPAVLYYGYPIWAIWLGRRLRAQAKSRDHLPG